MGLLTLLLLVGGWAAAALEFTVLPTGGDGNGGDAPAGGGDAQTVDELPLLSERGRGDGEARAGAGTRARDRHGGEQQSDQRAFAGRRQSG